MPYATDCMGIYRIVNTATGKSYVGQSVRVKKRVSDHFNLLRRGDHPNEKLQRSFKKHGDSVFTWEIVVECEDASDLDALENAFLSGHAFFDEPVFYNIAHVAKTPMRGRKHTDASKARISKTKKGRRDHVTDDYREKLRKAQLSRLLADPEFVARVRYIVDNPDKSYAERGRVLGMGTGNVRRLALRYTPMKENLPWQKHS